MGKEIDFNSLGWIESDDFIAFAFGDFNSKAFYVKNPEEEVPEKQITGGIIRTSDGDRYNINLVPPMNDKTADVPGGDGQYYFGTYHKPKVFDISFAFDDLTKDGLRKLKQTFAGKEMREFVLSEELNKVYMVKVTSQPNIKALCFGDGQEEVYKGEGSVQFTAYWPYGRDKTTTIIKEVDVKDEETTTTTLSLTNIGDIPAHFIFSANPELEVSKIKFGSIEISGKDITDWNSKIGIIKSDGTIISYTGDGLYQIPVNGVTVEITHKLTDNATSAMFEYYNWYY